MAAAGEQTMTELVTMHSGNASAVDRHSGRVEIKPSGMDYEKLPADLLVVTDLAGRRIKTGTGGNQRNPSVDLPHPLYVYNHCPDVCGIVHTHSNYATSFALPNGTCAITGPMDSLARRRV
jgi:L-ribulose-5-phosphate 4-epimerase